MKNTRKSPASGSNKPAAGYNGQKGCEMAKQKSAEVTAFIAKYPPEIRKVLEAVRKTIRSAAPGAEEGMGYGVPAYKMNGRPLVYFAAFKKHLGFYPAGSSVFKKFKKDLAGYEQAKGTIRFPIDVKIPYRLITKIVEFRVNENLKRA